MRRGELLGLRWVDVDLTTGRVAIRQTLVMVDGRPAMAEPKTAKGRRSLTLAPEVLETLRTHRAHRRRSGCSGGRLHRLGPGHYDRGRSAYAP
jgi:integrase